MTEETLESVRVAYKRDYFAAIRDHTGKTPIPNFADYIARAELGAELIQVIDVEYIDIEGRDEIYLHDLGIESYDVNAIARDISYRF